MLNAIPTETLNEKQRTCERCRKVDPGEGWNFIYEAGMIVGSLCPECLTPEEHIEGEIFAAMLDFYVFPDGRIIASPKFTSD